MAGASGQDVSAGRLAPNAIFRQLDQRKTIKMEADIRSIESLDLTSEQQRAVEFLTEFSKQMVVMAFHENNLPTSVSSLVAEIYRVCDQVIAGCLRRGTKLPCKQGCFWCCFLRVKVTPLEVICIMDYLQSSLQAVEVSAFRQRLGETERRTRGMDGDQSVCAKRICPLIADGKCIVYPVRPITCRIYHSLNPTDCELSLDDDRHRLRVRHDISGIGMGIFAGLTEGLRMVGVQNRMVELNAGLRIAMEEPELMKAFIAGQLESKIPLKKLPASGSG